MNRIPRLLYGYAVVMRNIQINTRLMCCYGYKLELTDDQKIKVLDKINGENSELSKYDISKSRLKKIEIWKRKHGKFASVEQVLELDTFGLKILNKFYDSIINEKLKTVKLGPKNVTFVTPSIKDSVVKNIKSCVALTIGTEVVSWSRYELGENQEEKLTELDYYQMVQQKPHLSDLIQSVLEMNRLIPKADVYITENPLVAQTQAPGSPVQINVNVKKSQIIGMLMLILSSRSASDDHLNDESIKINVYFMRQYLAARLFKTLIGSERVSSEKIIEDLLPTIPLELEKKYTISDRVLKELLGQTMLLALTFIRLCVKKCPKSLNIVNKNANCQ